MSVQTSKQNITIKKYANRRLYNTATSSYVTLEDLCAMVKEGETFNVYDAKTSEDITRSVLTQIIVEEENKTGQQNLLPISFLRQLIGFYGDNMQWMVPKYLEHSMEMFTGNQDQIRDYYKTTFGGMFPFGTTLEDMGKQNMSMFENTLRLFTPFNLTTMLGTNDDGTAVTAPVSTTTTSTTGTTPVAAAPCCDTTTTAKTGCTTACRTNGTGKAGNNTNKNTTSNTNTDTRNDKADTLASVTNLKPRTETSSNTNTTTTTPMPNVASATASNSTGADDMQQKIANLQRQLADLAKSRA
ncbi:MAG TPA: polyhydroxyalkanoate synthesis repressor PhaR [Rhodospirillaceae bacterium]|nr:polyhydroxyalkanoate synthesis repressor PhaR [Rhodospirillaceae bacterium]